METWGHWISYFRINVFKWRGVNSSRILTYFGLHLLLLLRRETTESQMCSASISWDRKFMRSLDGMICLKQNKAFSVFGGASWSLLHFPSLAPLLGAALTSFLKVRVCVQLYVCQSWLSDLWFTFICCWYPHISLLGAHCSHLLCFVSFPSVVVCLTLLILCLSCETQPSLHLSTCDFNFMPLHRFLLVTVKKPALIS